MNMQISMTMKEKHTLASPLFTGDQGKRFLGQTLLSLLALFAHNYRIKSLIITEFLNIISNQNRNSS